MSRRPAGFTIIELMLVIGIIGIIATIAIPLMLRFQLRAKAAEGRMNLAGIRVAQESYFAEFGRYVDALPVVPTVVGPLKKPWTLAPTDDHGFNTIGFKPDGQLYFQYGVVHEGLAFTVAARADIDGDGEYSTWGYVQPAPGTSVGIVGPYGTCLPTGVIDPVTEAASRLKVIGPCDLSSGRSEY